MPIRPENIALYPGDWADIRKTIRVRALGCCEFCGVPNKTLHPVTGALVVLTVAHLDHHPANCDPDNLRALCQRCHNQYDAPVRALGVKDRRREAIRKAGQMEFLK